MSNKAGKILFVFFLLFSLNLFFFSPASAQNFEEITGLEDAAGEQGADYDTSKVDLIGSGGMIVRYVLSLLGVIMMCIVLIAFFIMNSAGGNDEQVESAKNWIKRGIVGILIIMAAYFVTVVVVDFFAGKEESQIFDHNFQEQ